MAGQGRHEHGDKQNSLKLKHPPQQVAIVMVPFPAQSHLNQLLHLSHLLASSYNLPVHYAGSAPHNRQAKLRYPNINVVTSTNLIHFHDFPIPRGRSRPSSFLDSLLPIISHLRQPISQLLQELSTKFSRLVVVHDSLMPSVVERAVESIPNVEAYTFHCVSAFTFFFYTLEFIGSADETTIKQLPNLDYQLDNILIPSNEGCNPPDFADFMAKQLKMNMGFESGSLYNTSRVIELEGQFIELLEKRASKLVAKSTKHFAVGPFNNQVKNRSSSSGGRHRCLEWLDKQEKDSVIYVSFGTTTSMSNAQIRELAFGLLRSGMSFLWVLSNADFHGRPRVVQLPEEYGTDNSQGMVVRDWAPQLEILDHPSTGGFMNHCGWGSCIESMSAGVPMAAWPMHSDQPKNAVLVTQVLKVGVMVRQWADRAELVMSSSIANVVRRLMATGEGRAEMRERAKALGNAVRGSLAQGGVSRSEMDSFVDQICRNQGIKEEGAMVSPMIRKPICKM